MAAIVTQPVAVAPNERIRRPRRHYTCAYCQKVFKRSEHCIRHERTHTNEKPFSCRFCRRSYSRKDLVTRHERTLHAQGQAEPSAIPPAEIPAEADCESEGSLSGHGDDFISGRQRKRHKADAGGVHGAADTALQPSESEPNPASSAVRGAMDSPSNHSHMFAGENIMHGSVTDESQSRHRAARRKTPLPQSISSLANILDAPETQTQSIANQAEAYPSLHFDMYDASSQMAIEVDHNSEPQHQDEYSNGAKRQLQQHTQQQQAQELYPFPQFHDAGAQANALNQNLDPGLFAAFESTDMTSFFTFSPFPAGLFDVGQNMPNMAMSSLTNYQHLHNSATSAASRSDLAISPASAPPAHSPSQLLPAKDHATSNASEPLGVRDPPSNLPLLVKDEPLQIPSLASDRNWHASLCKDLAERLGRPEVIQEVPSSKLLQGFLTSYLECYDRHQRFIHLSTMSMANTPSPLILGMCCIGALYRLDRRRAERLYRLGVESIAKNVREFLASSADLPLWVGQTKILLTAYAALSGDKALAGSVIEDNGFYTLLYGKTRLALDAQDPDISKMTWDTFVRRESWKRLLIGIYVASTVHFIIWDINPYVNTSRDLEIEVVHEEALWNAKTEAEWADMIANQPRQEYRTFKDGLASIMSDSKADSPRISACRLSPLTAHLLMHAVVVHVWQLVQVAQALSPTSGGALGRDPVSSLLLNSAVRSLTRSHELLVSAEDPGSSSHEDGTSQIFNCQATLRMAYIRLFSDAHGFERPSLMTSSEPGAARAFAQNFAMTKLERSPQLFNAVVKAFEGLSIPVRMGHMLVRKTAALRWSPAHAISGWDCALFVCKWVHSVEMDRLHDIEPSPAESELLDHIKEVLEEAEYDPGKSKSLAAGVARTWSWLLQDVWVWGVTPLMGAVLEQMGAAFERVHDANRRPGS